MEPDEPTMTELYQLLSCTHDALIATDKNLVITLWNDTSEGIFGWSEKEALGLRLDEILKTEVTGPGSATDEKWEACAKRLAEKGSFSMRAAYHCRNGLLIHADVRAKAIRNENNEFQGAAFSFLALSKDQKSEEPQHTCIDCYRALFDMLYEGFCILEIVNDQLGKPVDIRVLGANIAYEKLTGQTTGEFMRSFLEFPMDYYIQIYNSLDLKNGPAHFEYKVIALNQYYDVYAYLIDDSKNTILGVLFQDITERKQNENLLRQYSERLESAIDAAHMAYWDWDPVSDHVVLSDNASNLIGLKPGETPCCSGDISWLMHPDDVGRYRSIAINALETGGSWHCEYRVIRPCDGKIAWFEERASSKKDPETGKTYPSGIVWDITDRKKNELAILQAKEQSELDRKTLEAILKVLPSGILLIDANDRKICYMNRRAIELYGCNFTGLELSTHIEKIKARRLDGTHYPIEELPVYQSLVYGLEVRNSEMIVEKPDGSQLLIVASSAPLYDSEERIANVLVIFDDITERKRTELALRESENKYHSLFRSMDEGLCVMELIYDQNHRPVDFRFIDVNPAFEKLTGLKSPVGCLVSSVYPGIGDYWLEALGEVARNGEPLQYEREIKGLNRWFNLNTFRVQTNGLETIAVLFYDVTREMIERNEMAKLIKIQDEVFANVSHELKTPLSVIFGTIQLLELYIQRDSLDANRHSVCKSVRTIKQNCYRFTKLINNIVDLSRIDSGFFRLDLSNENIVEIVENIVQSIADHIRGKGLNVVFDTDVEEKVIGCDPGKIERILLNLISNAIKFSNPQGTISVSVSDRGNQVEIAVRDTGIGIEEKYLNTIFERFNQVDKTLARNAEGSGIGLSLVKSIVDLHGGNISVESEVGKGSTFKVCLPVRTVERSREPKQKIPSLNKVELINIEFSDIYHL